MALLIYILDVQFLMSFLYFFLFVQYPKSINNILISKSIISIDRIFFLFNLQILVEYMHRIFNMNMRFSAWFLDGAYFIDFVVFLCMIYFFCVNAFFWFIFVIVFLVIGFNLWWVVFDCFLFIKLLFSPTCVF